MRHFLLPRAIVARSLGMVAAATVGRLVTASGLALRVVPCLFGTVACAINVAAIAAGADDHLYAAARAEIEARARQTLIGVVTETWTKPPMGEIIPRHSCSARCGARRRCKLARLGSALCLSSTKTTVYRTFLRSLCSYIAIGESSFSVASPVVHGAPHGLRACLRVLARQKVAPRHARQSLSRDCLRVAAVPLRAFDWLCALRYSEARPGRKNRRSRPNRKTDL
jgi:hypothetical protein